MTRAFSTIALVCFAAGRGAAGELSIAGGVAVPGGPVPMTVGIDGFGAAAVSADVGVSIDASRLAADPTRCAIGDRLRATHGFGAQLVGSTLFVHVFARGLPPLPPLGDGPLAACDLAVRAGAPPGQIALHAVSPSVADGNGENLEVTVADGRVLVLASLTGDANCDASVDAADLESLVGALFPPAPSCPTSDVNGDGRLGAADLVAEAALLAGVGALETGTHPRAVPIAPAPVQLTVGSVKLDPSQQGSIDVTLDAAGRSVAGVLNDIALPYAGAIPERAVRASLAAAIDADDLEIDVDDASGLLDFGVATIGSERIAYGSKVANRLIVAERGRDGTVAGAHAAGALLELPADVPDCAPSAELELAGKSAVFSYLPAGCTPGVDCAAVRAAVLALDDLGKIPDGIALYRCRVAAGANEGAFPLDCPHVEAASVPSAAGALPASCVPGRIAVGDSGLSIGNATGSPGQTVDVAVDLDAGPSAVAAVDLNLVFDAARLAIGAAPCRKAARLTSHRLIQSAIAVGRLRLVVIGLDDPVPPIGSGPIATCSFQIAPDALIGSETVLAADHVQIADAEGQVICGMGSEAECVLQNGAVSVVAAPTPTATTTPSPTATSVPCVGDCDGDRRVAIDELILGIDIGNGLASLDECVSLDASGDGAVDVAELVAAVRSSLGPCRP